MRKIASFLLSLYSVYIIAQVPPPPGDDGAGTHGPGAPASPIDMLVYPMILIAVFIIIFFTARKFKS